MYVVVRTVLLVSSMSLKRMGTIHKNTCAPCRVVYNYAENIVALSAGALSEEQLFGPGRRPKCSQSRYFASEYS